MQIGEETEGVEEKINAMFRFKTEQQNVSECQQGNGELETRIELLLFPPKTAAVKPKEWTYISIIVESVK